MTRLRLIPSRRRRQRGQALAEFALAAPIFFMLVFGIIQVGLVLAAQDGLVDGARNAARRAATYRINDGSFDVTVWSSICTAISDEISTRMEDRVIGYTPSRLTKDITYEWVAEPDEGDPLIDEYSLVAHVTASYANPLYVPLISYFLDSSDGTVDNNMTLDASEQMRVENPAIEFHTGVAPPAPPPCP